MKTLKGMKKGFSSLENKKLKNPSSIIGGETNDQWTDPTCDNNCQDVGCYTDGVRTSTETSTKDCKAFA